MTVGSAGNKKGRAEFAPRGEIPNPALWNTLLRRFFYGLAAATTARRTLRGRFANQFGNPDGRDEFLCAVIVEIDRCPVGVGFSHNPKSVLIVANGLPLD
jgi:hypothetical protein